MNRHLASVLALTTSAVTVVVAAMSPGKAYADDITIDTTPFASSKTRAEVRTELLGRAALLNAEAGEWAMQHNDGSRPQSAYTKQQVRSEYKSARSFVNAMTAEDSGSRYLQGLAVRRNASAVMGGSAGLPLKAGGDASNLEPER